MRPVLRRWLFCLEEQKNRHCFDPQKLEKRHFQLRRRVLPPRSSWGSFAASVCTKREPQERPFSLRVKGLILLFTSLFSIPLARQSCLDAALLAGLQVVGVTFHFLDDVLLLYLPLESTERIFQRFAFLNANLSQVYPPPNPPKSLPIIP